MRLLVIMFFIPVFAYSQTWPKFYGLLSRQDYSWDVIETYDKGYLILGGYQSDNSWIIKTDINGNVLWDKVIESSGINMFFAVNNTPDGGFIIAGEATLFENINDPVIVKINACGEKEWCKVFRTPYHHDFAYDILTLDDGSAIILTLYNSYSLYENIHLHKLDPEGNILWKREYARAENYPDIHSPTAYRLFKTNDNGFMLTGWCYYPDQNNPTIIAIRALYIKIASDVKEEWLLPFGSSESLICEASGILELPNNRYIGFGGIYNDPEPITPYLTIINTDGSVSSYNEFINDTLFNNYYDADFIKGLLINDKIVAILEHNYELFSDPLFGVVVIDTLLNLYQARAIDTAFYNFAFIKTHDNKFLTSSISLEFGPYIKTDIMMFKLNEQLNYEPMNPGNYTYDSLCMTGPPQSGYIYLDDCDIITSEDEIPSPEEYYSIIATIPITAYPNPAETEITLAFENTEHHTNMLLECYNIYGQKVHNEKIYKGKQQTKLSVSNWSKGLYFVVVKSNAKVAGSCRFVIR
jgi:hypothetical protein